jgi:hypothetical protein
MSGPRKGVAWKVRGMRRVLVESGGFSDGSTRLQCPKCRQLWDHVPSKCWCGWVPEPAEQEPA